MSIDARPSSEKYEDLRKVVAEVYEGLLVDRSRMDAVFVRLNHETWRKIQEAWYEIRLERR